MATNGMKIAVYTHDKFLYQKIRLEFLGTADVLRFTDGNARSGYALTLVDADSTDLAQVEGVKMSRHGAQEISLPFRIGSLLPLVMRCEKRLRLAESERMAIIDGAEVKLTELEYSLLSVLYESGGEYVAREELLSRVWKDRADKGILNVYVHYLREKLEHGSERIILSSRSLGYKINEIFLAEGENA